MNRPVVPRRVAASVALLSAVAVLLTAAIPHAHTRTAAAAHDPQQACRVCDLYGGFSATPPAPSSVLEPRLAVLTVGAPASDPPGARVVIRLAPSRAPPFRLASA